MNVASALRTDRMCKAITGLTVREFKDLLIEFIWNYKELVIKSKPNRIRKIGGGRGSYIETIEEKLLYILWYMKVYPTFDLASFLVGFARGNACTWMHALLPVLEQTMKRKLLLPQRQISSPEEYFKLFPEAKEVFLDGTERKRQRPVNPKKQRKTYSGKKKAHTMKNIVISDKNRKVLVVTKTKSGRRHDKRLMDKESLFEKIPKEVAVYVDTAANGAQKVHSNIYMPKKKPKGRNLTPEEKEWNKLISSYRVIVEHAICGIKRYRCLFDPYRNRKPMTEDKFMLLAAGLWNYHLS